MVVLPAALACNSIVGFDDFQKVSGVRSEKPDDTEDESDAGRSKGRDADAPAPDGPAPPSSCDPTKPFDSAVALAGPVNSAAFEVAPSLMNDELTMVFQRTVGVEGGSVLVATRSSIDQPFGDPTELTVLSQGLDGVQQPTMTGDGLLIFFVGISARTAASTLRRAPRRRRRSGAGVRSSRSTPARASRSRASPSTAPSSGSRSRKPLGSRGTCSGACATTSADTARRSS